MFCVFGAAKGGEGSGAEVGAYSSFGKAAMFAEPRPRVSGLGIVSLDYLFVSPWASRGGGAPVREWTAAGGGLVGTAIVAAARLGAETRIRTWVGDDEVGEAARTGLAVEGVNVDLVQVVPGQPTLVAFIHVEEKTGERTIFPGRLTEVSEEQQIALAELPLDCDALLVDAIWGEASVRIARRARAQGIPVVADFSPNEGTRELASVVSTLVVPRAWAEQEAPGASWEARLRRLAELGPEFVAITAGAEGCYFLDEGKVCNQPAFEVPIYDTTGAGDVFHGAFAYALARKWPVARGVEFASAVAAISCRALGGRKGIPGLGEVEGFLGTRRSASR